MFKKICAVLISAFVLASCTTLNNLDKDTGVGANDTIFVIGVKPANYRFGISLGELRNGNFIQDFWLPILAAPFPEDGYIVAKSSGNYVHGWMSVVEHDRPMGSPLRGATTLPNKGMAFQPALGKVVYIADVEIYKSDGEYQMRYSQNIDNARAYIDSHYPALKGKLESWPYEIVEIRRPSSGGGGPIFIYVGGGR